MAAGLSSKQINSRIYNRLKATEYRLDKAGVNTVYEKATPRRRAALVFFEGDGSTVFPYTIVDGGFNITYSVSHASNGETCGFQRIFVTLKGESKTFGWQEPDGTIEAGIEYVITNFTRFQ